MTLTSIQIREEISKWLVENFAVLSLGQELRSFGRGTALLELRSLFLTTPRR